MSPEEREEYEELQKRVAMLHSQQQELERKHLVFASDLAEQSKMISDVYIMVDNKLNNKETEL